MRKHVKKDILQIFTTLYEAHGEIRKLIDKNDLESVVIILGDCQNAAVQIGNVIEQSEGEGFITVKYLEDYCEALYEVSQSIGTDYTGKRAQKVLDKKLIAAENSVKNDVVIRLEAIFLSYKCAMLDSLLSVFTAADSDPLCDAYLIPIPYYDRNPDGSLGQFHYEGDEYPEDLPITHYKAYDIAARRPDVIYIHNAYDDHNLVTSVDPRFYSSELKKYTDMLVYIPYFVLNEVSPDNKAAVEKMKHFVTVPGVFNADKVIVQSEDMRQIYINILADHLGNTTNDRRMLEKKILGLGSPKLDRVMNTACDSVNVPESWKEKIYKSDGTKKVVVFYNTTIGALLNYGGEWVEKIQYTLSFFKKMRDEFVLLWRPHPLILPTLCSMRPDLLDIYNKTKEKYISEAWGIFDDSADLNRAIALSDVYYGDRSSVEKLFISANKDVRLQRFFKKTDTKKDRLFFDACANMNECTYASSMMNNGLYKIDEKTKMCEFVGLFPDEPIGRTRLFSKAININDKYLVFVPRTAEHIAVYNISSKSFTSVYIAPPERKKFYNERLKFCGGVFRDGKIYIFGMTYPAIIKLSVDDWNVDYIEFQEEKEFCFTICYCVCDHSVILPSSKGCFYGEFRFSDEKLIYHFIDKDFDGFINAAVYEKELLLSVSPQNVLLIQNIESGEISCEEIEGEIGSSGFAFSGSYIKDSYLYIFPYQFSALIKWNISEKVLERDDVPFALTCKSGLSYLCRSDKYIYFLLRASVESPLRETNGEMYRFDTEKCRWEKSEYLISNSDNYEAEVFKTAIYKKISAQNRNHDEKAVCVQAGKRIYKAITSLLRNMQM